MKKFDDHWDTVIDENEKMFDAHPGVANFAYSEALRVYEMAEEEIESLRNAMEPLVVFWSFVKADHELNDNEDRVMCPENVVISIMVGGGSTMVTVKQFDELVEAYRKSYGR